MGEGSSHLLELVVSGCRFFAVRTTFKEPVGKENMYGT